VELARQDWQIEMIKVNILKIKKIYFHGNFNLKLMPNYKFKKKFRAAAKCKRLNPTE
jgi:hypothetical protein